MGTAAIQAALNNQPHYGTLLPNPFFGTLPRVLWNKLKQYFGYTATFNPIVANTSLSVQTNINKDAAFIIVAALATVTDAADTTFVTQWPGTVQIRDEGDGANLFDNPTHFSNVFGTAQAPAFWPIPYMLQPGSTLTTTLQNLEAVNRIVRVCYLGFKVFNKDV